MRARWTSGTKTVRTWAAALCALLALFLTLPALADAASIIVRFDLAGHPRQDQYGDSVQIGLYRAGRYEDGAFVMEPPYDQVDLTDIRSALQADMALAEMGRLTEGVSPDASGTLSGGSVTFSGLTPGVYYGKKIGGPSEFGMDPFFVLLTSSVTVQPKWSEVTSARLVKIWDDAQDQDGRRPDSISARLYADGQLLDTYTLTAPEGAGKDQDWTIEVSGLAKYRVDGGEIAYEWREAQASIREGYTARADAPTQAADNVWVTAITNHYTPETTSATVKKIWQDDANRDAKRPDSLTVILTGDGERVGEYALSVDEGWTLTVEDLPVYRQGKKIEYAWSEGDMPEGYSLASYGTEGTVTTLINPYTPGKINVLVRKVWDDDGDRDRLRPQSVTARLFADGEDTGLTAQLSQSGQWQYTFEGLDEYRPGSVGEKIVYTVREENVPEGYTCLVEEAGGAFTLTNTHPIHRVSVSVAKVWDDGEDQDGIRPASVRVELLSGNRHTGRYVTLSAQDGWTGSFDDLPQNDENGQPIEYRVVEETVPEGYTAMTSGSMLQGYTIRNTHVPSVGSLRIVKSITVGGEAPADASADGAYTFVVDGPQRRVVQVTVLAAMPGATNTVLVRDLRPGTYTVTEVVPEGMTAVGGNVRTVRVEGDNEGAIPMAAFVNDREPEGTDEPVNPEDDLPKRDVTGSKIWLDEGNAHGMRPGAVTVRLYANGTLLNVEPEWSGADGDVWTYIFRDVPETDADGNPIAYTVSEEPVGGYEARVQGFDIYNALIPMSPEEYVDISGMKTWSDDNNRDGKRPNYVTVVLLRDGEAVSEMTVTAATEWNYTFPSQPADDGYGHVYTYSIRENPVEGYFPRLYGFSVTNVRLPGPEDIEDIPEDGDDPPIRTPQPVFGELTETELEELLELYDYSAPLFGRLLGTGDETPLYPFLLGGVGAAALAVWALTGRKRKKRNGGQA